MYDDNDPNTSLASANALARLRRERTREVSDDCAPIAPVGKMYVAWVDDHGQMHTWLVDAKEYGLVDDRCPRMGEE